MINDVVGQTSFGSGVTLQDTGSGNRMSDLNANINALAAKYHPGMVQTMHTVMSGVSQLAYQKRQSKEMEQLGKQFDPQKVSGGTFATILGNLESRRGADISRFASASLGAYQQGQAEIGSMYRQLTAERTQLQQRAQDFKYKMAAEYPGLYGSLSKSERRSIENGEPSDGVFSKFDEYTSAAKAREDAWIEEQRNMTRARFAKSMRGGSGGGGTAVGAQAEYIKQTAARLHGQLGGNQTMMDGTIGGTSFLSQQQAAQEQLRYIQQFGTKGLTSFNTLLDSVMEPTISATELANQRRDAAALDAANQAEMEYINMENAWQSRATMEDGVPSIDLRGTGMDFGTVMKNPAQTEIYNNATNAGYKILFDEE